MRIRLKKGKQRKLINSAKENFSWEELAKLLSISKDYLRLDLREEKRLLPEKTYKKLCSIIKGDFDKYITEKLEDNWGRSKGGRKSDGSTIRLIVSNNKLLLAEFIGIVLGDGNICHHKKGKKVGVYQVKIAGDYKEDKEYHLDYIRPLCESLFNLKVGEQVKPEHNERFLFLSSKQLVSFFNKQGLKPGNKIKNQSTIPLWVFRNNSFLKACLRGLIDTDGCIHRMSKKDPHLLRIKFTNYNLSLLNDARKAFLQLGFNVSKIICGHNIQISRKADIERYLREIGFSNPKHLRRFHEFKNSPVV